MTNQATADRTTGRLSSLSLGLLSHTHRSFPSSHSHFSLCILRVGIFSLKLHYLAHFLSPKFTAADRLISQIVNKGLRHWIKSSGPCWIQYHIHPVPIFPSPEFCFLYKFLSLRQLPGLRELHLSPLRFFSLYITRLQDGILREESK